MNSYINKGNEAFRYIRKKAKPQCPLRLLTALILLLLCATAQGQTQPDTGTAWEDVVEMVSECMDEAVMEEDMMEELYETFRNPIDINRATEEQLKQLPFLTDEQAKDILDYIAKNGEMQTLGEMMMVPSLFTTQRMLLRHFLTIHHKDNNTLPATKDMYKNSRHELAWSTGIPLYTKAGYRHVDADILEKSPNKVYRGDRYRHSLRYAMQATDHLSAGLQMEKDAGETGVDYWAGHVMAKNVRLWGNVVLKKAVAGCYKISFGKGLAVNTSAKLGKMMMMTSLDRMDKGISPHSSMSETGYFRGAAATLQSGQWELSAYASYRPADATIRSDSTGITSLKTDGLHRTLLERSKRGNIHITDFGANIHWGITPLQLSATLAYTSFSIPLSPTFNTEASAYRRYNSRGRRFVVGSIAYSWRCRALTLSGETALSNTDKQNGWATLNCIRWKVNSSNTLSLIGRYYEAQFNSINGKAFGENALVQNEAGAMVGWSSRALRNIVLDAHADMMYFPWKKSGVSTSSYASEVMVQAVYSASASTSMSVRYKCKAKQKDIKVDYGSKEKVYLGWRTSHSVKCQLTHQPSSSFLLRATALATHVTTSHSPSHSGWSIGGNMRWSNSRVRRWVSLSSTLFFTDSYEARLYGYETNLPYTFSSSSYFYKGTRIALAASMPFFRRHLTLNAKIASTIYFDRKSIGTALEEIRSNHREDMQLQAIWRLGK